MPKYYGLAEDNLIFRKHCDKTAKLMDEWWYMVENYSKRDQLSFMYILWKNGITLENKKIDNVKTDYKNFLLFRHKKQRPTHNIA